MTATTIPSAVAPTASTSTTTSLRRTAAVSGVLAAAATTAVAGAALAADVPIEIAGEQIPLLGFAQMTLLCSAIGALIAATARRWSSSPRRTFVATTAALTLLSFVPDVTADATTATILVLLATHVVAAAIVIPSIARVLPEHRA